MGAFVKLTRSTPNAAEVHVNLDRVQFIERSGSSSVLTFTRTGGDDADATLHVREAPDVILRRAYSTLPEDGAGDEPGVA